MIKDILVDLESETTHPNPYGSLRLAAKTNDLHKQAALAILSCRCATAPPLPKVAVVPS